MRIDLHAHSSCSDGTTTPTEVVEAALRAPGGALDVLALTDHDTCIGWAEAANAAAARGVKLVPGLEISTKCDGRSAHLLAYAPDPDEPALQQMLQQIISGRDNRMPGMVAALRAHGVDITEAEVRAQSAGSTSVGRPHVADAMVAKGLVPDRSAAFAEWLSAGRPGYVERYAPTTAEAIGVVLRAGGVPVLAHPWGRHGKRPTAEGLADLVACGLAGFEVDHQDHKANSGGRQDVRAELRSIGEELGVIMTGSSDYHGAGKVGHELGCNTTAPVQFEALLSACATARHRAGRGTEIV